MRLRYLKAKDKVLGLPIEDKIFPDRATAEFYGDDVMNLVIEEHFIDLTLEEIVDSLDMWEDVQDYMSVTQDDNYNTAVFEVLYKQGYTYDRIIRELHLAGII